MSRRWLAVLVPALVGGLAAPPAGAPAAVAEGVCPAGTTAVPITWDAPGLEWPQGVVDAVVRRVGGTGLTVVAALSDPASRNGDDSNPLADFGEAHRAELPGWQDRTLTGTRADFGPGALTLAMNSLTAGDTLGLTFHFTQPVVIPDFTVGDVDFLGLGEHPWQSHQDEVELVARRNAHPVELALTGSGLAGPYREGVDGDLDADDPRGTLRAASAEPVTSLRLNYSNGPDDEAAEATRTPPPVLPQPATSVSDSQSVRISGFTACLGTGRIGDTVFRDADGDGTRDEGEEGLADVTLDLLDPQGGLLARATTDEDGRYSFEDLPPLDWTVRVDPATVPADFTGELSRTVALAPGRQLDTVDFAFRPPPGSTTPTTTATTSTTTTSTATTTAPETTTTAPVGTSTTTQAESTTAASTTTTSPAAAGGGSDVDELASTGADLIPLLPLGVLLVAAGGGLLLVRRRRAR